MNGGISIDVSEFQAALKEYLSVTSKDIVTALNGKARDLALRAAQATPVTTMSPAAFKLIRSGRAFIGFRAKQKYGPGFTRQQWGETMERMARKRLGKGFMKSGFVKASRLFRNTGGASSALAQQSPERFKLAKATGKLANKTILAALFDISWSARDARDANGKQSIVSPAIAKAARIVTADMRAYILRKMEQQAKKNSAATVRAISGVFR